MTHGDKRSPRRSIKVYARQLNEAHALTCRTDNTVAEQVAGEQWFDDTLTALIKGQALPDKPPVLCQ